MKVEVFVKIERIISFADHQDSDAGIKTKEIRNEWSNKKKELLTDALSQQIKSAVIENYELENRENDKTESSSLAYSNSQNSTARSKIISFLITEYHCN